MTREKLTSAVAWALVCGILGSGIVRRIIQPEDGALVWTLAVTGVLLLIPAIPGLFGRNGRDLAS